MLEALAIDDKVHLVDITKREQINADFPNISPNNKIPAIIDYQGSN